LNLEIKPDESVGWHNKFHWAETLRNPQAFSWSTNSSP